MHKFQLLKVTAAHVALLREISITTFRDTYGQYNTDDDMRSYISDNFSENRFVADIKSGISDFYLAMDGKLPLGYIKVNYSPAQTDINDGQGLELERIYVCKEQQGKKIGQFLLDASLGIAKLENLKYLWLGVWDKNANARAFYAKNNFRPFGTHTFMLGKDEQLDILLRLDIV